MLATALAEKVFIDSTCAISPLPIRVWRMEFHVFSKLAVLYCNGLEPLQERAIHGTTWDN